MQESFIKKSMSLLLEKYDALLIEHEEAKGRILKLEKSHTNTTNKCVYLEKCNLALEHKMQELEQSSHKRNIEIIGVEQLPGENWKQVVCNLSEKVNLRTDEIESVRRNRIPKHGLDRPASIIAEIKVTGMQSREQWLAKRRDLTITSDIITNGTSKTKIYINEDLTKTTKSLLWNAKKELRGIYKYVSTSMVIRRKSTGKKGGE